MMLASAILGTFSSLMVALILKHVDLRRNPSLEFGMMLLGSYFPYCCAEAMDLSGITSILFAGIGKDLKNFKINLYAVGRDS